MSETNFDIASKEELVEHIRSLYKKIGNLNAEKSSLRGKLSNYRASIAEAYLLDGFEENGKESNTNGHSGSTLQPPSASSSQKQKKENKNSHSNKNSKGGGGGSGTLQVVYDTYEPKVSDTDENAEDASGTIPVESAEVDTDTIIAELQSTIMDLQQQLADSRRYNMRLDLAHQTSIRESKMLKELGGKTILNDAPSAGTGASTPVEEPLNDDHDDDHDHDLDLENEVNQGIRDITIATYVSVNHDPTISGHSNMQPSQQSILDKHEINPSRLHPNAWPTEKRRNENPSIASSEAEELTVNSQINRYSSKHPKVRKVGVSEDGFEEYDIDFSEPPGATEAEHGKEKDNARNQQLRHQLLEEQLRVEELKHERRKSVMEAEAYQEELSKIRQMTTQEFEEYRRNQLSQEIQFILPNSTNEWRQSSMSYLNDPSPASACAKDCECQKLRQNMRALYAKLQKSEAQVEKLTRERRNSLARMSERAFKQMLDQEQEHYNEKDQLNTVIEDLTSINARLISEKYTLLQNACQTIDHLRENIKLLSKRPHSDE